MTSISRQIGDRLPNWAKKPIRPVIIAPFLPLVSGSTLAKYRPGQAAISCPICASNRSDPLRNQPVEKHFMLYDHRPWARLLVRVLHINGMTVRAAKGRWHIRYVRCQNCRNGFQDFPHSSETVAEYYKYFYRSGIFSDRGEFHSATKQRVGSYLLEATKLPKGARILDVGCAEGIVCRYLEDRGYEAYGVEPFPPMARFATERLGLVNILNTTYRPSLFPDRYFDAITIYHVLEHVFSPIQIISAASGHIKTGGYLLIQVPNFETPVNAYANDHLTVWSPSGLGTVLESRGFEILEQRLGEAGLADVRARIAREDNGIDPLKPGAILLTAQRIRT